MLSQPLKSSIVKRSVIIDGHKTSVSLEAPFWHGLREIAELRQKPLSNLLHEIDAGRASANLSSAIRVFVLEYFREHTGCEPVRHDGGHASATFITDDAPALS
jgi:predicted DNA-binding ribbon-helix-helix protein